MKQNVNVVICPPCGENVGLPTKRGAYKAFSLISPSIGPADHFLRKGGRKNGFTLIELLVVVLIIGILAAVAVPQYQKAVMRSRYATLKNMTKSIANAQEVYYLAHGQYAARFDELDIDAGGTPQDENDNCRNFDWGQCIITSSSNIRCRNANMELNYVIYFENSISGNNVKSKTYCQPEANIEQLPLQHQLCQQETGSSTYKGTYRYPYVK